MQLNLPELEDALEDVEFFERVRTEAFVVELALVLYMVTRRDESRRTSGRCSTR
jgi:hypothetical protein